MFISFIKYSTILIIRILYYDIILMYLCFFIYNDKGDAYEIVF